MPKERARQMTTRAASAARQPAAKAPQTPAGPAMSSTAEVVNLQRLAGNTAVTNMVGTPVQRLIDGFYAGGATKVPTSRINLTAAFKKKHVAADESAARSVTGARIDEGKPQAMVTGSLGNTVAKEADWLDAIDKSAAVIPDQDAWSGGMAVKVNGWDAKRTGQRSIGVTTLAEAARTVGGYMKKQGGKVEIDHVSGQQT